MSETDTTKYGGIGRTRFAELLYEHEGFADHASNLKANNREVPVWIESALTEEHCGDCTQVPAPCIRCHAGYALSQADELQAMIDRAKLGKIDV